MLISNTVEELTELIHKEFYEFTKRPFYVNPTKLVINELDFDLLNKEHRSKYKHPSDIDKIMGMTVLRTLDLDRGKIVIS